MGVNNSVIEEQHKRNIEDLIENYGENSRGVYEIMRKEREKDSEILDYIPILVRKEAKKVLEKGGELYQNSLEKKVR